MWATKVPLSLIVLAVYAACLAIAIKRNADLHRRLVVTQLQPITGCEARDDRQGSWTTVSLQRFIANGYNYSGFVVDQSDSRLSMAEDVSGLLDFLGMPYGLTRTRAHTQESGCGIKDMQGECHTYTDSGCWEMERNNPLSLEAQYYLAALRRSRGKGSHGVSNGKINVAIHFRSGDVRNHDDGHYLLPHYYSDTYKRLENALGSQIGTCTFFAENFDSEEDAKIIKHLLPNCRVTERAEIRDVWSTMIDAEAIIIGRSQFDYTPAIMSCGIVIAPEYSKGLQHSQGFDNFGLKKEPKWLLGATPMPDADAIRQQVAKCREVGDSYMQKDMRNNWPFGLKE